LFQADNEIETLEPPAKLLQSLLPIIRDYEDPSPPAPGFADYIRKFTGGERYYDDNQWLGITALDAYARTKDPSYLSLGQEIYTFMMTGYDTVLTGGLYWKENRKTSKNTCSNGPGILVALQLYEATKQQTYLDTALLLYHWVDKTLKAPSGLYYDNMSIKGRVSTPILSYNTGTMLESNLYLYECTGDKHYLHEAISIADSSLPFFYGGTHFRDSYWFNVVLLRGYQHLLKYDKDTKYILGYKRCLDYALQNEKNENGLFAEKGKPLDLVAHGGMLEMLARFAWLDARGFLTPQ
jgi:rhamnogalacturonyl hydrolase YesR